MKRGLVIAVGVLLPFVALVALGFALLPTSGTRAQPPHVAVPSVRPQAVVKARPAAPVPPSPPPSAMVVPVQQCFDDIKSRVRKDVEVTLTFDISTEGNFEHVAVKQSSWQDPLWEACLMDAMEGARAAVGSPSGSGQSQTFTFSASATRH